MLFLEIFSLAFVEVAEIWLPMVCGDQSVNYPFTTSISCGANGWASLNEPTSENPSCMQEQRVRGRE